MTRRQPLAAGTPCPRRRSRHPRQPTGLGRHLRPRRHRGAVRFLPLGGASWALRNPDNELLGSRSADDGRRNFEKGKTFSKVFKGIHDLELKYGDSGLFVRGKYWYDVELKDEGRPFKAIDDHNRKEARNPPAPSCWTPSSTTTT